MFMVFFKTNHNPTFYYKLSNPLLLFNIITLRLELSSFLMPALIRNLFSKDTAYRGNKKANRSLHLFAFLFTNAVFV